MPKAPKGEKRLKAAHHRNAISPDESKGILPEPARSRMEVGALRRQYKCRLSAAAPFGGWRHHLRHGVKRVTGFSVAQGLPTNPVTCFPVEEVRRSRIGGSRRKAANHRNAVSTDESKRIKPKSACSRQLEADCLHLYPQRLLPADWYLTIFLTLTILTEILRLRLRMTMRAGRQGS